MKMSESWMEDPDNGRSVAAVAAPESNLDAIVEATESASQAVARADMDARIESSHKFPRGLKQVVADGTAAATLTREIAESCRYSLPRDGKRITGPSIRLAEIMASVYGNFESGVRIVDANADGGKSVVVEGYAWDLQKNVKRTSQVARRTTTKAGKPYGDDMRNLTVMAASAIAVRNATFAVIPRSYVDAVLSAATKVAVGDDKPLGERREVVVNRFIQFAKKGGATLTEKDVAALVGKPEVDAIDWDDLADILGFGTAVKDGMATWDAILEPIRNVKAPVAMPRTTSDPVAESAPEPARAMSPVDEVIAKAMPSFLGRGGFRNEREVAGFLSQHVTEHEDGSFKLDFAAAEEEIAALEAVASQPKAGKK